MVIRYLSEAHLGRLRLSAKSVVDAIEKTIADVVAARAWSAPKSVVLPDDGRYIMTTLAVTDDPPQVAVKAVVLNPHNAAKGLSSIDGVVTILDGHTGQPRALIDGKYVTAIRTAGLSLLAAKHLARETSSAMAFLGCGVQARAHLAAFVEAYPIKSVYLFGRGKANIDSLAEMARNLGCDVHIADSAEGAMRSADVIVSSLTRDPGREPFLDAKLVRPGAFATITDLAEPWIQSSLNSFNPIFVDDLAQERASGVKLLDPSYIRGDLADLVTGRSRGRDAGDQRTAFIFRGLGVADLAIASLALSEAEKSNIGTVIDD